MDIKNGYQTKNKRFIISKNWVQEKKLITAKF